MEHPVMTRTKSICRHSLIFKTLYSESISHRGTENTEAFIVTKDVDRYKKHL
jgi:hypothetical protein